MIAAVASRWQQWVAERRQHLKQATLVNFDNNRKERHNWWWNKGSPPRQASLSLIRGDTSMFEMQECFFTHPLAVGSDGDDPEWWAMLEGKVRNTRDSDHESTYNIKFTTTLGFNLTFGYSRHKDPVRGRCQTSHAWVAFGEYCEEEWHRKMAVDFLLNIVGYKCHFDSHRSGKPRSRHWVRKETQPLVPMPTRPVPGDQPLAVAGGAASSSSAGGVPTAQPSGGVPTAQPLAAAAGGGAAASSTSKQDLAEAMRWDSPLAGTAMPDDDDDQPLAAAGEGAAAAVAMPAQVAPSASSAGGVPIAIAQPLAGGGAAAVVPMPAQVAPSASSAGGVPIAIAQPLAGGGAAPVVPMPATTAAAQPLLADLGVSAAPAAADPAGQTSSMTFPRRVTWAATAPGGQPLAAAALEEAEEEELDHVGVDTRPTVGQGTQATEHPEQFAATDDSEAEERAFKRRVASIRRVHPAHKRFSVLPRGRFASLIPVGGGPLAVGSEATIHIDMALHRKAVRCGIPFGMNELTSEDENGRRFVASINHVAITRRFELLERISQEGGRWRLTDELPDTDVETGAVMDPAVFASRWQQDPQKVLLHLVKKHEGELVELEGGWTCGVMGEGEGPIPDKLFDPQFAKNAEDHRITQAMAKGKSKGKSKEEPAVGGKHKSKGKSKEEEEPAVGGKGKSKQGFSFFNRVLELSVDGTWRYRQGTAITLSHLLLALGEQYTAAKLYAYYNMCAPLAVKRPHAWADPVRQAAAIERFRTTGYYGFGRRSGWQS